MSAHFRTIRWLEHLAEQEQMVGRGEKASVDVSLTKEEILKLETQSFVRQLYRSFSFQVRLFNDRLSHPPMQIKLGRGFEGKNSFFLSRNNVRLSMSDSSQGAVHFQCDKKVREESVPKNHLIFTGLVEAKFAAFHEVEWLFLGSAIRSEQLACHYLTEFIQASRDAQ